MMWTHDFPTPVEGPGEGVSDARSPELEHAAISMTTVIAIGTVHDLRPVIVTKSCSDFLSIL